MKVASPVRRGEVGYPSTGGTGLLPYSLGSGFDSLATHQHFLRREKHHLWQLPQMMLFSLSILLRSALLLDILVLLLYH